MNEYIVKHIQKSIDVKKQIIENPALIEQVKSCVEECIRALESGRKIIFAGNGGSAADSQHLAAELVSRFNFDRPALPSIALTTDTSMLTAIGNDYGFESLFSRQIQANANDGDVLFAISTSGNSGNLLRAVETAKSKGVRTVALCGNSGKLKDICDNCITVPSKITPFIQESHICIGHIVCGLIEEHFFGTN